MKTFPAILICLFLLPSMLIAQEKSASEKLFEGIYQEEVTGNLDKATEIFKSVLENYADDRSECAQALYHLGLVEEKKAGMEKSSKAESYYVQIIERYAEVGDYIDLARNRLEKLNNANTFIDPRDGHKYKWVKIGNQIWMAENLAYMPHINPPKKQEYGIWVYDYNGHNVAEAKSTENYHKYGCLYDWPTAMALEPEYLEKPWDGDPENHQGLCPPGWHLPTDEEWMELEMALGMPDSAANDLGFDRAGTFTKNEFLYQYPPVGSFLKSASGWHSDADGNNLNGFSAAPAGIRQTPSNYSMQHFNSIGVYATFWTANPSEWISSRENKTYYFAWTRFLTGPDHNDDVYKMDTDNRTNGESVRCVKDYNNEYPLEKIKIRKAKEFITPLEPVVEATLSKPPQEIWSMDQNNRGLYISSWDTDPDEQYITLSTRDSLIVINKNDGKIICEKTLTSPYYRDLYIHGDTIVFASSGILYCRSISSWMDYWQYNFKNETVRSIGLRNGMVVIITDQPSIYCIKADNGELLWTKSWNKPIRTKPVLKNQMIYFGTGSSRNLYGNNELVCIDANTGSKIWTFELSGLVTSGMCFEDENLIFGCNDQYLYNLNKLTGELNWRLFTEFEIRAKPIVTNSKLLVGDQGNHYSL